MIEAIINTDEEFENIVSSLYGKAVYVYGLGKTSRIVSEYLKERNVCVSKYIVTNLDNVAESEDRIVFDVNEINYKETKDYVLIVAVSEEYHEEILKILQNKGAVNIVLINDEFKRIICERQLSDRCEKLNIFLPEISCVNSVLHGDIKADSSSNIFISDSSKYENAFIRASNNSMIFIDDDVIIGPGVRIVAKDNSRIYIGKKCKVDNETTMLCHGSSIINILNGVLLQRYGELVSFEYGILDIDNSSTFGSFLNCRAHGTDLYIGSDCMISQSVTLIAGDGHMIVDNVSGRTLTKSEPIIISNHVWIGAGATLLSRSEIGSGSVIGAASLVNSKCGSNSIMAGNPARVTRSDISWSR